MAPPHDDPPAGGPVAFDSGAPARNGAQHDHAPPATDLFRSVGLRVRGLRLEHRYTLDELSTRSGVSRRMITMLEAGETNASLGTLDKLARALDCDFYTLVTGRGVAPLSPGTAGAVAPVWEDGRGSTARLLISHAQASTTELWQWHLVGGARYEAEPDPPGSEEILLVSSGRLVIEVGPDRYSLRSGGYLRLPTDRAYAYANPGRSPARFVRVIVMP